MKIERAAPLLSPVYDMGQSVVPVGARRRRYWEKLWDQRTGLDTAIKGRVQRGVDLAPYPRRFFPGRCRSISPDDLPLVRGTMFGEPGVECSCSRFGAVLEDERKVTGKPTYFTAVVVVVI